MGFFDSITDELGITSTGDGAKAAKEAGRLSAEGINNAIGSLDTQYGVARNDMMGGNQDSIRALRQGMNAQIGALGASGQRAMGMLEPLAGMGMDAINAYQQGSTAQGYGRNIDELISGGSLDPLIASNRRGIEAELSAQGLGRSGYGVTELSQLPVNAAMGIESELQNRRGNVMNASLPALYQQAGLESQYGADVSNIYGNTASNSANNYFNAGNNLSSLTSQYGSNVANAHMGLGSSNASAILAAAQADAADRAAIAEFEGRERAASHDVGMSFLGGSSSISGGSGGSSSGGSSSGYGSGASGTGSSSYANYA